MCISTFPQLPSDVHELSSFAQFTTLRLHTRMFSLIRQEKIEGQLERHCLFYRVDAHVAHYIFRFISRIDIFQRCETNQLKIM